MQDSKIPDLMRPPGVPESGSSPATPEDEVCARIELRVEAVRARDVEGSAAVLAPDMVMFDVVNPLRRVGADGARERAQAWVAVAITFLALIVAAGVRSVPGLLIVLLEREFAWSRSTISLAVSISLLLYGLIGAPGPLRS